MSVQRARQHLEKLGMQDRVREFEVSSATVELAALALGVEGKRIAKTLSLWLDDKVILLVTAGDAKIDNAKYRSRFGKKARMLSFEEVEPAVGHGVGGVCPFGINEGIDVYLDVSLKRFETVFPACGSDNSAVRLTPEELERCAGAKDWVDVCKGWQPEQD